MITGEIKRFLRDDGAVKVSRFSKTLAYKISAYTDQQEKAGNPTPTVEELAQKLFDEYEVTEEQALADTKEFIDKLVELEIIDL